MFQGLSYESFKEPRGFIKILQWIFAICAFATTVNFSTTASVDAVCKIGGTTHLDHIIEYPFDLDQEKNFRPVPICESPVNTSTNATLEYSLIGNAKSDSEFFVTTGVLSFIYSTALIAIFLLADYKYTSNETAPKIDFWISAVFALFWLSGFAAWSHGLTSVRVGADPRNWQVVLNLNGTAKQVALCDQLTGYTCEHVIPGSFGGIVISILFGSINFLLWATNLWFLYKETWLDRSSSSGSLGLGSHPGTSGA